MFSCVKGRARPLLLLQSRSFTWQSEWAYLDHPKPAERGQTAFCVSGRGTRGVVLNRANEEHRLNLAMLKYTAPLIRRFQADIDCHFTYLRSTGDASFSAGWDIKEMAAAVKAGDRESLLREQFATTYTLATAMKPFAVHMDGVTKGSGAGLVVHARHRVASPNTVFSVPQAAKWYYFPDSGVTHFLTRLGHLGTYLALTGAEVKGYDLIHTGIATHYMTPDRFDHLILETYGGEGHHSTATTSIDMHDEQCDAPYTLAPFLPLIKRCFSLTRVEYIFEELETARSEEGHSPEVAAWLTQTIQIMKKANPVSLTMTHRAMALARLLSIEDSLRMDFIIAQRFLRHPDFLEGLAAEQEGREPVWTAKDLKSITDKNIAQFFRLDPGVNPLRLPGDPALPNEKGPDGLDEEFLGFDPPLTGQHKMLSEKDYSLPDTKSRAEMLGQV